MPFQKFPIGTANPGLSIALLDQSESMARVYTEKMTRAEFAASAVNRVIHNIVLKCSAGATVKNRCHLGVIVYGAETSLGFGVSRKLVNPNRFANCHFDKRHSRIWISFSHAFKFLSNFANTFRHAKH